MANENANIEMMPVYANVIVAPFVENPYAKVETEEGFKYADGSFENPDSGEMDKKDMFIGCGEVIAAGPKCLYLKAGDHVFYDKRSVRPVPFFDYGFLLLAEPNIVCVINENLRERFADAQE